MTGARIKDMPNDQYITLKVLAGDVRVYFHRYLEEPTDVGDLGKADWDMREIHLATHKEGKKLPFEAVFAHLMHELNHIWSIGSGHHVYEPNDDPESPETIQAERTIDAISQLQAQTLLKSGMINETFIDDMKRLIDVT